MRIPGIKPANLHRALSLVVATTMALQTLAHFPAAYAAESKDTNGAVTPVDVDQYQALLDQTKKMPPGQPHGALAIDRFLLLEQNAVQKSRVGRMFSLFSDRNGRELAVHRQRVKKARQLLKTLDTYNPTGWSVDDCASLTDAAFGIEAVTKGVVEYVDNGRVQDTPLFVWEHKKDMTQFLCIQKRVRDLVSSWEQKIADFESATNLSEVPNITLAPETEIHRLFNWWDLSINVLDREGGEVASQLKMSLTADGHDIPPGGNFVCATGESCRFSVASRDNETLNQFHIPAHAVATFGPYVVFIHENSYDAESGTQYLSFVDLSTYGAAVGNTDIPVFRLPLLMDAPATELTITNNGLNLNEKTTVRVEAFLLASEIQQVAFNITANLTDPDSIAAILPYIDVLQEMVHNTTQDELADLANGGSAVEGGQLLVKQLGQDLIAQIQQNKQWSEFAAGKTTELKPEQIEEIPDHIRQTMASYTENVKNSKVLNERLKVLSARVANARKFKAQLIGFYNRVTSPVPNASLKIKRATALVAGRDIKDGGLEAVLLDRPWLSSFTIGALLYFYMSPDSAFALYDSGVAVGSAVFDYAKFALLGMGEAVAEGTKATFGPLLELAGGQGSALSKQYIENGNAARTLIGVSSFAGVLFTIYMVPHLLFNLQNIMVDRKKPDWQGFVEHQRRFMREYNERLAADEGRRRQMVKGEDGKEAEVVFTAEEEAEIQAFLTERARELEPTTMIGRAWSAAAKSFTRLKQAVLGSKAAREQDQEKIKGFWSAVLSITFSYPAMELTLTRWAKAWNWWAGVRFSSIGFLTLRDLGLKYDLPIFVRAKPIMMATRILYPEFFNTVVARRSKRIESNGVTMTVPVVTVPTQLNGGLRGWGKRDLIDVREMLFGKPSSVREAEDQVVRELTDTELKELTEGFENSILGVEDAVYKTAFKAGLTRLPDFIADRKELVDLLSQKPLHSLVEKRVVDLPAEIRTFLRLFFEEVYLKTMQDYLQEQLTAQDAWPEEMGEGEQASLLDLKKMMVDLKARQTADKRQFQFDPARVEQIAAHYASDEDLFARVVKQTKKGMFSLHNIAVNRKFGVIADLDPEQNRSMKRYSTVQERMKSANSLSRAVRAEISKLLITSPINVFMKVMMAAGIYEGAFKPIQEHMFGPNSFMYLSVSAFYMPFASGFVISMMADAWMKLQTDARQDELGDFGNVPKGEDAEKSFLRFLYKQFQNPNNSLWANWVYCNEIAIANFPAALANMGLFYFLFSGRLDLSFILGGYVLALGTPISGFYYKLDNAFERAAEYPARGIKDTKWLAHPEVQEVFAREKQSYRNWFNLLNSLYLDVQNNWLGNIEVVPTSLGTRGFVRAVFGGPLLEEAIVNHLLGPLRDVTAGIPGVGPVVNTVANGCQYLLTNGNTDLHLKGK